MEWIHVGDEGLRDRADLTWHRGANGEMRIGLFETGTREILDMPTCPMMSPRLSAWFHEYREMPPPMVERGSVRLRVSPAGDQGVWLDFSNVDVKALFEEKTYLRWLSERAFVEIGQRRKPLIWVDGEPKLRKEPELRPWFETYGVDGGAIAIYQTVGGFSQPGFRANRALVTQVLSHVKASPPISWVELFSGAGNFTLALAASGLSVRAYELDDLAIQGLERSSQAKGLDVSIERKDLLRSADVSVPAPSKGEWGLVVDPPRSGLKRLVESLNAGEWGRELSTLIYVSCFGEAFAEDTARLSQIGFSLTRLSAVDQFIYSPHTEWIGTFRRG